MVKKIILIETRDEDEAHKCCTAFSNYACDNDIELKVFEDAEW